MNHHDDVEIGCFIASQIDRSLSLAGDYYKYYSIFAVDLLVESIHLLECNKRLLLLGWLAIVVDNIAFCCIGPYCTQC